ncbi:MAG: ribosome-associated translation inhibitor RaiA [Cytophagaceae bacterium]|nr:ribosome-associated translation inhibitor RaiA [Cytophagaceae bacterium]MBK9510495.1 ribosome-associated translation inhibitor RaiA [Cytophagaceae bacterium]MBK9934473.1 ribosome-associated translation inhibitor RaiA [Cytophagaceae bacterium]MBL0300920.1 ribosome-associated translation inhibitor RaiA [Cytophagaceae bacterium]MBL0323734.1 ribosome-associated translation inhibitor RaiA [Cytophagaceae bacterium]
MKVQVNAVKFSADNSLVDFIQKKLNKLDTFYDKIISSEVFLRLDKGEKLNTHKKLIEVKLNMPGSSIFVKEEGDTFEAATDLAMETLTRKVKQFKEKAKEIGRDTPQEAVVEEVEEEHI